MPYRIERNLGELSAVEKVDGVGDERLQAEALIGKRNCRLVDYTYQLSFGALSLDKQLLSSPKHLKENEVVKTANAADVFAEGYLKSSICSLAFTKNRQQYG